MRWDAARARARFGEQRVARLATVGPDGEPHLVPIVFAIDGDVLYSAVDAKPKSTRSLRRLADIAANPHVAVLADHYDEDWTKLWWARAEGAARVLDAEHPEAGAALERLRDRYPAYSQQPPPGPVIAVDVARWSGWSASD